MRAAFLSFTMVLAAAAAPPDFSGEWHVLGASGLTAPAGFTTTIRQTGADLQLTSRWEEPKNGQYGLTLLGMVTPEFHISTAGRQDLNQVGPFVFRSRSRWEGSRLITEWNTSDFMDQSFRGTWTRYLSPDGRQMTLEIAGTSSAGKTSRATLVFRRE